MANQSQYVGKSAEYLVLSELTANGYNASLIGVDEGIDIVAIKDSKLFTFQVKARKGKNGSHFNIHKKSFAERIIPRSYFVFVLIGEENSRIAVMSYDEVRKRIDSVPISLWDDRIYPIAIKVKDDKIFFGNMKSRENEISRFEKNWDL